MTSPTDKKIEVAARAMMHDLTKRRGRSHGCLLMFEPTYPDNVCVRGHIDLYSLAEAALKAAGRTNKR